MAIDTAGSGTGLLTLPRGCRTRLRTADVAIGGGRYDEAVGRWLIGYAAPTLDTDREQVTGPFVWLARLATFEKMIAITFEGLVETMTAIGEYWFQLVEQPVS